MRGAWPVVGFPLFLSLLSCAGSPTAIEQGLVGAGGGRQPWEAPRELEILSWNLGFGGLGEGAEFYPDGGRRLIPSSRRDVLRYVAGIGAFLGRAEADLFLLQEVARPSAVNRRVDLLAELSARLPGRWLTWSPEVSIPFPRVSVGPATFARGPPRAVERVTLPGAKRWYAYHLLVARFPVAGAAGELVLANVHLSAFDENASLRRRQLESVTAFLLAEALRGNWVVLGGDWNLLLAETRFPHTTAERYLFWVHPLPDGFPPPGWRLVVDDKVPTVRTLERPYARGENYTAVIDGFVVSPNVTVLEVRNADLGFRFSDHQPVLARLRLD
jgi:endonuclease/exonuclease/phosphatase family metal-dependent hydrolase